MSASLEMENKLHTRQQKRPKTAAKDLECYRDVVPNEFFQQIGDAGEPLEVQQKKHTQEKNTRLNAASSRPRSTNGSSETSSASDDRGQTQKYVVQVPQEVESLFQVSDLPCCGEEMVVGGGLRSNLDLLCATLLVAVDRCVQS